MFPLSRRKNRAEKGTGEGRKAGKRGKARLWLMTSDRSKGVPTLESLWLAEQYNRAPRRPKFFVSESLCLPLDSKGEEGRDYVWLRAWLTQSSSACLLFIKLHLLDRKG